MVAFRQGRGGASKDVIKVKKDLPMDDDKIQKSLYTVENDSPQMVIFVDNDTSLDLIEICGDGIVIHLNHCDLVEAVLSLIGCFYVFDIAYPRIYSQMLGIIQHLVIGDPYMGQKSNGFVQAMYTLALKK
jgi:hypothetical protein